MMHTLRTAPVASDVVQLLASAWLRCLRNPTLSTVEAIDTTACAYQYPMAVEVAALNAVYAAEEQGAWGVAALDQALGSVA